MAGSSNGTRSLTGQRAMVTGAGSDLGAEIARALAAAGAAVAINGVRGSEEAERIVKKITAEGGEAIAVAADVSREDGVKAMCQRMSEVYGSIDILVNNADLRKHARFIDMTLEDWEEVLRVNLTGQFLCAREAAKEFLRRGVVPELSCSAGKIICLSSVHDVIPWARHAHYSASKAGVLMLMKTLARELATHKIRVNAISAGAVKTAATRAIWGSPEREAELLELIPYGRWGQAADIARAAVWLASDESDYVTGTTLYVDGGMSLYPGFLNGL
ncbi:MAG: glucose 1-dehydrogenase [Gammaproteobacteria bacterium]